MTASKIQTPEEYQRAKQRLEELKRSNPNSPEVQELSQSVEAYRRDNPGADDASAQGKSSGR